MMAISEIRKDSTELNGVKKMLVLSLGTGKAKNKGKYTADRSSKWGWLNWTFNYGANPLIEVYQDASSDMVDFHISTLFQTLDRTNTYLRIQVHTYVPNEKH